MIVKMQSIQQRQGCGLSFHQDTKFLSIPLQMKHTELCRETIFYELIHCPRKGKGRQRVALVERDNAL